MGWLHVAAEGSKLMNPCVFTDSPTCSVDIRGGGCCLGWVLALGPRMWGIWIQVCHDSLQIAVQGRVL